MPTLDIYLYHEIFAADPSGGNSCWVALMADNTTGDQMQSIAKELGLPATAFVTGAPSEAPQLQFFSPAREFSMCGHAVVAAACTLVDVGAVPADNDAVVINFQTMAGEIPTLVNRGTDGAVYSSMLQRRPWFKSTELSAQTVAKLLGLSAECIDERLPIETGSTGLKHVFIPIRTMASMSAMQPDFSGLRELSDVLGVESVAVFSLDTGDPGINVRVRDFCPAIGVSEEPASGTTNGAVGSYLVRHGKFAADDNGDATIVSHQGIELGRPSKLKTQIHVDGKGGIVSVRVGGTARQLATGTLVPRAEA